jgi:hypothetical protein
MEHLQQAVAKLELMLRRAQAAQCSPQELRVLRAAQLLIIEALLPAPKRATESQSDVDHLRPVARRAAPH